MESIGERLIEKKMFMIDKEGVRKDIRAIKEKLTSPSKKMECIAAIEKTIDTKESHIWRADAGSCIGNVCNISSQIEIEIGILRDAVGAIKEGDNKRAVASLENYVAFIEKYYDDEMPAYR
jgi:hypothetical protein